MVQKEKSKRGRPRRYDPEAALNSVLEVFWRAGYSAASLDDICLATGMNKPSVYAAFGDKRSLYLRSIERYRSISREQMREALAGDDHIKKILSRVYDRALDLYFSGSDTPLGCFMVGAVINDAVDDAEIRAALAEGLTQFDAFFGRTIKSAQDKGEIDQNRDAVMLGKFAAAGLYYLAVRARAGEPRGELEKYATATINMICGS